MSTLGSMVDEVLGELVTFDQPRATYLTAAAGPADREISVTNTQYFSQGVAEIGDELIFIDSVDMGSNKLLIAPDGRGYMGTIPTSHAVDARVNFGPRWTRKQVTQAVNDTIVGTFPTLWGVKQHQFPFNVARATYELPADAEQVLSVQADQFGPSRSQQELRRFYMTPGAPADEFTSGKSLTLLEGVSPGQTVTVTYRARPTPLASSTAQLVESGLRESARLVVLYGAVAQLTAFIDVSRLDVGTAQADEYDSKTAVGTAARASSQLIARYQLELENERQRLRLAHPVSMNMRKR